MRKLHSNQNPETHINTLRHNQNPVREALFLYPVGDLHLNTHQHILVQNDIFENLKVLNVFYDL